MTRQATLSMVRAMVRVAFGLGLALGGCDDDGDASAAERARLPDIPYCERATDWPVAWERAEQQAIDRIDRLRAQGADCGDKGYAPAAPTLRIEGALRCAARVHATAMAEQGHVGHATPDGVDLPMRIEAVGYDGAAIEHLAAGPLTADELVDGVWRPSNLHCDQLMSRPHIDIGVAFIGATKPGDPYETYWVAVLGNPPGNPLAP